LNRQIALAEMQQQLSNLHIQNWQAEFTAVQPLSFEFFENLLISKILQINIIVIIYSILRSMGTSEQSAFYESTGVP
jgi:hypothetical protein